jgi:hypothetical protein
VHLNKAWVKNNLKTRWEGGGGAVGGGVEFRT